MAPLAYAVEEPILSTARCCCCLSFQQVAYDRERFFPAPVPWLSGPCRFRTAVLLVALATAKLTHTTIWFDFCRYLSKAIWRYRGVETKGPLGRKLRS